MKKIVVLGAGNELFKDEGIGVHVARILQEKLPSSSIEVIEGGTSPDACYLLDGVDKLVIVDAVKGGCEPGAIYRFTPEQIVAEKGITTSIHQMGILENLSVMGLIGCKPKETVIIGVEPKELEPGLELSPELQGRMPKIIETVIGEIGPLYINESLNEARV
ncbi:MAG: hydrogenase maturation protease [Chloroflexi bacterium]|nr:hydrogenase maturation protease [Chloroflexota bacterium]